MKLEENYIPLKNSRFIDLSSEMILEKDFQQFNKKLNERIDKNPKDLDAWMSLLEI